MIKRTCRPQTLAQLGLAAGLLALAFTSCKPEDKTKTAPAQNGKAKKALTVNLSSDDAITQQIQSFYDEMKSIHSGATVAKDYTPEDLNFLIEGAYNYLSTTVSHDREDYTSFNIETEVAKNVDGKINASDASKAFYALRDKLATVEAGLTGSDKTLAHFDLEVEDKGGSVVLKGTGDFATGFAEMLQCADSLGGPINRGYLLESGWKYYPSNPTYLKGQCDVNVGAKTASNRVYNVDGSARMIIKYAMNKERGCMMGYCGYYSLISTSGSFAPQPIANPISQYTTLGISGGYAANKKQVDIAESYLTPTVSADPDSVFKRWLTRPMVNFYIKRMPQFFTDAIANSGDPLHAKIYTFNIETWMNAVHGVSAANNPGGWATDFAQNRKNDYHIQTAKFIKVPCPYTNKVTLGNL